MPILVLRDCALLVFVAISCSHLAREDSWRNGIDSDLDARIRNLRGQHTGDVVRSTLAGIVREMVLGLEHDTRDAGDVDDGARVAGYVLGGFRKQGQESSGHEVELWDVRLVDVGPVLELGGLVVEEVLLEVLGRGVASLLGVRLNAGVVDQDAEALLTRGDLIDKALNIFLASDVGNKGNDLASNVFAVSLSYTLQLLLGTADNVHLGPIDSEGLGAHEADPRACVLLSLL